MSNKDKGNLFSIVHSCEKILEFAKDFDNGDQMLRDIRSFDAILMNFINIGEAVTRVHFILSFYLLSTPCFPRQRGTQWLQNEMHPVTRRSGDIKDKIQKIVWAKIKSFRNIVAHNYFGIDVEEVWQIMESDIAQPLYSVQEIVNKKY